MARYVVRRLIQAIPIIIGISVIAFFIVYLAPGDPFDRFRSNKVSPEVIENLRRVYGLDQPLPVQFFKWFTTFWTFPWDNTAWGFSITDGLPVRDKIFERIPSTFQLMGTSLLLTIIIAIPVGILGAVKQYSLADKAIAVIATIGYALPTFWLGLILRQIFAQQLDLFPLFGKNSFGKEGDLLDLLWHLFLPALTITIVGVAGWSRYMRASMLEVLRADYIRTAKAKGLASSRVIFKHALRNALIPIVTLLGLTIPSLLAGAAITETVFSWPGLGFLGVSSVSERDYPVVLAFTMIGGAMVIVGNLLADILYAVVDPRIKY
ncbi:MAG TPA: ABC transporter permease [Candidatus Nanopelagicales bacterium]|nr:ABC transporter permease [Candidatus Nanopelagicales bacterium]